MKRELYLKLPIVEWDGKSPLYSNTSGICFSSIKQAESRLNKGETLEDYQLQNTKSLYTSPLDSPYFENCIWIVIESRPNLN